jgi:hypothetical protein
MTCKYRLLIEHIVVVDVLHLKVNIEHVGVEADKLVVEVVHWIPILDVDDVV